MAEWKLHFWDWDAPVLVKAVAELMRGWSGGQLDLSSRLILVPSAEASRRLREALAVAAAERDGAVIAPHVWHPELALIQQTGREEIATAMQERLVWTAVLNGIRLEDYVKLFPSPPAVSRESWSAGVAETLTGLRRTTGAGGWSLADVSGKISSGMDAERWSELARIERLYLAKLAASGLCDALEIKRGCALNPVLPAGVSQVHVIALADPTPLLRQWLARVATMREVMVWTHAPEEDRRRFDDMGVPLMSAWNDAASCAQKISLEQIHHVSHPQDQARCAIELLHQMVESGATVAVGLADPSLAAALEASLAAEGIRAFDPAGRAARQHGIMEVLHVWQQLAQSRTCRALAPFLRLDDVLRVIAKTSGLSQSKLLKVWDEFYQSRLPATLADAVQLSAVPMDEDDAAALAMLHGLLDEVDRSIVSWTKGNAPVELQKLLEWIYGEQKFSTEDEGDRGYVFLFGELQRLAQDAHETARKLGSTGDTGSLLQVVLKELEGVTLPDARGEVDMVLHGWLELLWEPADGLVICGFNDESVPGKIAPDSFLPDHVRERLGLPCQATRGARDGYLLAAMLAQRKSKGALHIISGQSNDDGDVLKPSRLLFACADDDLADRIRHLFPKETEAAAAQQPPHAKAWKLQPWRVATELHSVNVSLLSSYLRCPLRCYLEKFLKMSAVDASQREMTPGDFGGLVHDVLAEFGREEKLRDCINAAEIAAFFDETLGRITARRWGGTPLLSVALQVESARQRLAHFAQVQADMRGEGWRIEEVEFEIKTGLGLKLDGVPYKGRIDRIDIHQQTQEIRVWDYKTRHKGKSPADTHTQSARGEAADDPEKNWKRLHDAKGKARMWTDLQLPLYVWALHKVYPKAVSIKAGYIQLPTAVTEIEIEIWEELDEALIDNARECAEEIVKRMKAGSFWPPEEDVRGDAFEELFLNDAQDSVMAAACWKGEYV